MNRPSLEEVEQYIKDQTPFIEDICNRNLEEFKTELGEIKEQAIDELTNKLFLICQDYQTKIYDEVIIHYPIKENAALIYPFAVDYHYSTYVNTSIQRKLLKFFDKIHEERFKYLNSLEEKN